MLQQSGGIFTNLEELKDELKAEWHNMILFASDLALINTHTFIKNPSYGAFQNALLSIRQDLWGEKLSPQLKKLTFE
jgi:gamma-glutamylcysteine synthetase